MKIEFIGTGNIESKRFNASILVNDIFLIDIPSGSVKRLIQNNFDFHKLKAIFITHQHADHYFDLPIIIQHLIELKIKKIDIFCNEFIISSFNTILKLAFPDTYQDFLKKIKINFILLENNKKYTYDCFKITSINTKHGNLDQCFCFMFTFKNTILGYSGDTCYNDTIKYLCENCTHLILDCTNKTGNNSHMGIDCINQIYNQYPNKIIYINHLGPNIEKYIKNSNNLIIPNDSDIYYL